jgi:hypothetical protein
MKRRNSQARTSLHIRVSKLSLPERVGIFASGLIFVFLAKPLVEVDPNTDTRPLISSFASGAPCVEIPASSRVFPTITVGSLTVTVPARTDCAGQRRVIQMRNESRHRVLQITYPLLGFTAFTSAAYFFLVVPSRAKRKTVATQQDKS